MKVFLPVDIEPTGSPFMLLYPTLEIFRSHQLQK